MNAGEWIKAPPTDVVLFGNRAFASLAWHALTNDSPHRVIGFTVDREFLSEQALHDLPVVAFDEVEKHFDPARTSMLMSIGWQNANGLREGKYREAVAKGYSLISYVATRALVPRDIEIGPGCMIFEGAIVQPFAHLGNGVILRSGCHISHHVDVGDFCFVAAHAVVGGGTRLGPRCFIGLNATVYDNIEIGTRAQVGAGALISHDVAPDTIYVASPARRAPSRPSQSNEED
jgi:sugar O-acyltransferase (sialic acid O-acetyltransferase NeuD family)